MKYALWTAILAAAWMTIGCAPGYTVYREHRRVVERDTTLPPPMTIDDVIALAKDSVGDDVILTQMKATHSWFRLTNNDIRDLKENGVSDRVIAAMIRTADDPEATQTRTVYYYPSDAWYWGAGWYYPWYPSVRFGYGHRGWFHSRPFVGTGLPPRR
jgi:hypothetical protein